MIDNSDHWRPRPDEVLVDLMQALKGMENNLLDLISTANDEYITHTALMINDNL